METSSFLDYIQANLHLPRTLASSLPVSIAVSGMPWGTRGFFAAALFLPTFLSLHLSPLPSLTHF